MKKIKVLTSLVGLTGLSMGLVPMITSCSCNPSSNVELDESVTKQNITVKSASIVKGKDSTIEFNIKTGKQISKITLNVGNATLSETDVTIETNKVTIPAAKMVDDKVIVKSITLGDIVKVTKITITNTTQEVKVGSELELTASIEPATATNKELKWTVKDGTGTATITTHDNKTYLKGTTVGTVTVTAEAKDGSGVKSTAVTFDVKEESTFFTNSLGMIATKPTKITVEYEGDDAELSYTLDGTQYNPITRDQETVICTIGDGTNNQIGFRANGKQSLIGIKMEKVKEGDAATVVVGGSLMNLLNNGDGTQKQLSSDCFYCLFQNSTALLKLDDPDNFLPWSTLAYNCYANMFDGCSNLTNVPKLPAQTLAENCYYEMFSGCKSITSAPELSATQLAKKCYYGMFYGCSNLHIPPVLNANQLAEGCYACMFQESGLTSAPALPATTLVKECYACMFQSCSSLKINEDGATGTVVFTCPSYSSEKNEIEYMFSSTGGSFTDDHPTAGKTYKWY